MLNFLWKTKIMSRKFFSLVLFNPIFFSLAGNEPGLVIKSALTPLYWDYKLNYSEEYYSDSYSYFNYTIIQYEVSLINTSDSKKSYAIMSGTWSDNWTVNNDYCE